MAISELNNVPWKRKHDNSTNIAVPNAARILYPKNLQELIEICKNRVTSVEFYKAAGSHWGLSNAAISDTTFIETHDPNNNFEAMGRTLYNVVPNCLSNQMLQYFRSRRLELSEGRESKSVDYLYHFEAGKRIYQLYSELDNGDDNNPDSLASKMIAEKINNSNIYRSKWALPTMGSAGGQTFVGAALTGTHGGDIELSSITDIIQAVHLVADGGKHYWIERSTIKRSQSFSMVPYDSIPLTDHTKLRNIFGIEEYGGNTNFEIITSSEMLNSVIVSAGRFGIVYSVVIGVVPQYNLRLSRKPDVWQNISGFINDSSSEIFKRELITQNLPTKFLQIALCPIPCNNFSQNQAGVTQRWNIISNISHLGREVRIGTQVGYNSNINAIEFSLAGKNFPYGETGTNSVSVDLIQRACTHNNLLTGLLIEVINDLENLLINNIVIEGGIVAGIAAIGAAPVAATLLALFPFLLAFLEWLKALLRTMDHNELTLGEVLDILREKLLVQEDPNSKASGIFIWQCITNNFFKNAQSEKTLDGLSFAIMDDFNYKDASCSKNADSIEVFFNAEETNLNAFIEALLDYERRQEWAEGKSFGGYISLRYMTRSKALLAMQRWPLTCSVEISGLSDLKGTRELIDFALVYANDPNVGGILHWGQQHNQNVEDIEFRFNQHRDYRGISNLDLWKQNLAIITDNGRLNGFSNMFTRNCGLEV